MFWFNEFDAANHMHMFLSLFSPPTPKPALRGPDHGTTSRHRLLLAAFHRYGFHRCGVSPFCSPLRDNLQQGVFFVNIPWADKVQCSIRKTSKDLVTFAWRFRNLHKNLVTFVKLICLKIGFSGTQKQKSKTKEEKSQMSQNYNQFKHCPSQLRIWYSFL